MKKLLRISLQKRNWFARVTQVKNVCENVVTNSNFSQRFEAAKALAEINTQYETACTNYENTKSKQDKNTRDRLEKVVDNFYAKLITELNLDIDDDLELAKATGAELVELNSRHRKGNLPVGQPSLLQVYNLPTDGEIYIKSSKSENATHYIFRLVPQRKELQNIMKQDIITLHPELTMNLLPSGEIIDVFVCGMNNAGKMSIWSKGISVLVI